MTEWIGATAKWIGIDFYIHDELVAREGDRIEIHGKHQDGQIAVRGIRSESFFWCDEDQLDIGKEGLIQWEREIKDKS